MASGLSDPVKEIRDQVKAFEPSELLYYVTLLGALPGNEIKCIRLETLFKIIISTRKIKFKNHIFRKEDAEKLLNSLKTFHPWKFLEDFIPIQLFDYPAIWILGKRYNVFSGPQDRAYEFWKELVSDYLPVRDAFHAKGYDPVKIIEEILSLETTLVSLIRKHENDFRKVDDLLTPSAELFKSWKYTLNEWYLHSPNKAFYEQHSVRLGKKINHRRLIEQEPIETICRSFAIRFDHCVVPSFSMIYSLFSIPGFSLISRILKIKTHHCHMTHHADYSGT